MSFQQREYHTTVVWRLREDGFYEAWVKEYGNPVFTSRSKRRAVAYVYEWLASEYLQPLTTPVDSA